MARRKWRKRRDGLSAGTPSQTVANSNTPRKLAAVAAAVEAQREPALRPTPEARRHGAYRIPDGPGRHERPAVNMTPDCIAALMLPGSDGKASLTQEQHDAARDWQALRAIILGDLGVGGYRSCLDISGGGYDSTDGDVETANRWHRLRLALGPDRVAVLDRTCLEGRWPMPLIAFTDALDVVLRVR